MDRCVVDLPLLLGEGDTADIFQLGGQLLQDILFQTAQQKGLYHPM